MNILNEIESSQRHILRLTDPVYSHTRIPVYMGWTAYGLLIGKIELELWNEIVNLIP